MAKKKKEAQRRRPTIALTDKEYTRLKRYVLRENLAGRPVTVQSVLRTALIKYLDEIGA